MPITIKSTGMKYKNPDTGVYQGVDMLEEATIRDVIVDAYSPTLPYAVGEYCLYNGELYCCTTAIPAGGEAWNLAHWDKTNVTDELEDIKGAVDSIGSDDVENESNVSGTTVSDALDMLSGAITDLASIRHRLGATNLLPYPYLNTYLSSHDLTFTVNSDGSVTINGTANADTWFHLSERVFGTTTFSSDVPSTAGHKAILSNTVSGVTLVYTSSVHDTSIKVVNGTALSNLKVYPMICLVEDPITTHQAYAMTNVELTGAINDEIIRCDTAIAIPSSGNNVVKTLAGLTSAYELIRWNFSSSAENSPPVNLTWGTYDNSTFVIVNNGGTTSETIKPVFAKATAKTAT